MSFAGKLQISACMEAPDFQWLDASDDSQKPICNIKHEPSASLQLGSKACRDLQHSRRIGNPRGSTSEYLGYKELGTRASAGFYSMQHTKTWRNKRKHHTAFLLSKLKNDVYWAILSILAMRLLTSLCTFRLPEWLFACLLLQKSRGGDSI